jgi:hypothetical protein
MTEVKVGLNYLTAYGPGVPVNHKNGFFPALDGWYVDNDIGIVRFERDGRQLAYAISFFSQRVPKSTTTSLSPSVSRPPLGSSLSNATRPPAE